MAMGGKRTVLFLSKMMLQGFSAVFIVVGQFLGFFLENKFI